MQWKTSSVKTLSDLQNAFVKRIEFVMSGYSEGRVILNYRCERFCHKSLIVTSEYSNNVTHELSTSASEMTYIVSSGALNSTHSLTHSLP